MIRFPEHCGSWADDWADDWADAGAGRPARVAAATSPTISDRTRPPLRFRLAPVCEHWRRLLEAGWPGAAGGCQGVRRVHTCALLRTWLHLRFHALMCNCGEGAAHRMGTFEELVDRLASALDEAAEGIRDALRSRGRPQKFLANRVADASPSLISRWLSGARQLSERNRLPGAEAMRQIAAVLELPPQRARELAALGERIDELRTRLESEERGWRARAAEYRDRADTPLSGSDTPPSGSDALPPPPPDALPPPPRPRALPPQPQQDALLPQPRPDALSAQPRPDALPPPSGSDVLPPPSLSGALPPQPQQDALSLQSRPVERRTVPLMTAAIAAATVAVISFLGGMLAG